MKALLAAAVFFMAVAAGYSMSAQAGTCFTNCNTNPLTGSQSCYTTCP